MSGVLGSGEDSGRETCYVMVPKCPDRLFEQYSARPSWVSHILRDCWTNFIEPGPMQGEGSRGVSPAWLPNISREAAIYVGTLEDIPARYTTDICMAHHRGTRWGRIKSRYYKGTAWCVLRTMSKQWVLYEPDVCTGLGHKEVLTLNWNKTLNSVLARHLTWPQTRPTVNSYPWKEGALSLANGQHDLNFSLSHDTGHRHSCNGDLSCILTLDSGSVLLLVLT